jgi:hypothetical protein
MRSSKAADATSGRPLRQEDDEGSDALAASKETSIVDDLFEKASSNKGAFLST